MPHNPPHRRWKGTSHFLRILWSLTLVAGKIWATVAIVAWAGELTGTLVEVTAFGSEGRTTTAVEESWMLCAESAETRASLPGTEGWLLDATSAEARPLLVYSSVSIIDIIDFKPWSVFITLLKLVLHCPSPDLLLVLHFWGRSLFAEFYLTFIFFCFFSSSVLIIH